MAATVSVLGAAIVARSQAELLDEIKAGVSSGAQLIIPHHNLHSAALLRADPGFNEFHKLYPNAHVDGMALILWGRLLGLPLNREHRVTYLDLIGPLCRLAAERNWRIFHLGGRPGVGERAASRLSETYGAKIEVHHGYFERQTSQSVIDTINRADPQIVLVGMGMPIQELWLKDNLAELGAAVYLCSGGCFDYVAGEQKAPPRWSGVIGLEWLFRLLHQPRRLGRRYLVEPMRLLPAARDDLVRRWKRR